jgi:hypothetical protein
MSKKESKTIVSKKMSKYCQKKCQKSKCQESVKYDTFFCNTTKQGVIFDTFLTHWFLTFFLTIFLHSLLHHGSSHFFDILFDIFLLTLIKTILLTIISIPRFNTTKVSKKLSKTTLCFGSDPPSHLLFTINNNLLNMSIPYLHSSRSY